MAPLPAVPNETPYETCINEKEEGGAEGEEGKEEAAPTSKVPAPLMTARPTIYFICRCGKCCAAAGYVLSWRMRD